MLTAFIRMQSGTNPNPSNVPQYLVSFRCSCSYPRAIDSQVGITVLLRIWLAYEHRWNNIRTIRLSRMGFSRGKCHKLQFGILSPSESRLTSTSAHYVSYRWSRNYQGNFQSLYGRFRFRNGSSSSDQGLWQYLLRERSYAIVFGRFRSLSLGLFFIQSL